MEKIDQVRSMHELYRLVTEVQVWLGCGSKHTTKAVSLPPLFIRKQCKGLDSDLTSSTAGCIVSEASKKHHIQLTHPNGAARGETGAPAATTIA